MSGKIKVPQCPSCGKETHYCRVCGSSGKLVTRDKRRVSGAFKVVDWFVTRASGGLIIEDSEGRRYDLYMADIFDLLKDKPLGNLTLEETKKGSAYGWKVINEEAA